MTTTKDFVRTYLEKNALFCTSNNGDGNGEAYEANGLIQGHAYSMLSMEEVNGTTLVRIRNPHGQTEWNGPWSDGSSEWDDVDDEVSFNLKFFLKVFGTLIAEDL